MGTNLVGGGSLPPMLPGLADDLHIRRLVDSFQIEDDGRDVLLDRMPTKTERELFQHRNVNLTTRLRPCTMAQADLGTARKYLALMFAGFPALRSEDVDGLLNAYLWVLQKYPLFAIISACEDVGSNRIQGFDPKYGRPPDSPLMARAAEDHVTRIATEKLKIEKILLAKRTMRPPDSDGARERVMASLKDFHGRIVGGHLTGTITEQDKERITARQKLEARQAVLREWAHLGLSPIVGKDGTPMSPGLARLMGLLTGPEGAIR